MWTKPILLVGLFGWNVAAGAPDDGVLTSAERAGTTWRASVGDRGQQADCGGVQNPCYSISAAISDDGTQVAFVSIAPNFVPGDTNGLIDVFVRDQRAGTTVRVNVSSSGAQATNGASYTPSISADGRLVAFGSDARNLVPNDTNNYQDVFVHDRQTRTTTRVSVSSAGAQGNGRSATAMLTPDGRYVAFQSDASNLVAGDGNAHWDIFVHDRQTGTTVRVSVATDGREADHDSRRPCISSDGRFVAFDSLATNLVEPDQNAGYDAFVHDRDADEDGIYDEKGAVTTRRVSVNSRGEQASDHCYWPVLSYGAEYVVFESRAGNLVDDDTNGAMDIFLHELRTGRTERVSLGPHGEQGSKDSYSARLSLDGRYAAFYTYSPELLPPLAGDARSLAPGAAPGAIVPGLATAGETAPALAWPQILRRDTVMGANILLSVNDRNEPADGGCEYPVMTPDARVVAFSGVPNNLVPDDTNTWADVFVHVLRSAGRGDLNCDLRVDFGDITPFVLALSDPEEYKRQYPECEIGNADCNGDGRIDFGDVNAFVQLLGGRTW